MAGMNLAAWSGVFGTWISVAAGATGGYAALQTYNEEVAKMEDARVVQTFALLVCLAAVVMRMLSTWRCSIKHFFMAVWRALSFGVTRRDPMCEKYVLVTWPTQCSACWPTADSG